MLGATRLIKRFFLFNPEDPVNPVNTVFRQESNQCSLFGSLASSDVHTDSDVDLIVVTNDDHMPNSYKEKSAVYLKVSSALTDITRSKLAVI